MKPRGPCSSEDAKSCSQRHNLTCMWETILAPLDPPLDTDDADDSEISILVAFCGGLNFTFPPSL